MKLLIVVTGNEIGKSCEENLYELKTMYPDADFACISSQSDFQSVNFAFRYTMVNNGRQYSKVSTFLHAHKKDVDQYDWIMKIRPDIRLLVKLDFELYPTNAINGRARVYEGPHCISYGMSVNGKGDWEHIQGSRKYAPNETNIILDDQIFFFHRNVLKTGAFDPIQVSPHDVQNEWFHTKIWNAKRIPLNVVGIQTFLSKYNAFSGNTLP